MVNCTIQVPWVATYPLVREMKHLEMSDNSLRLLFDPRLFIHSFLFVSLLLSLLHESLPPL